MAVAELTLLGGFELRLASGEVIDLPGQKDRALLAVLAICPGSTFSREKLAGLLWSDRGDAQARDSLSIPLPGCASRSLQQRCNRSSRTVTGSGSMPRM